MQDPDDHRPLQNPPESDSAGDKTQVIPKLSSDGFLAESASIQEPCGEELPDSINGRFEAIESETFELGIDSSPEFRRSLANFGTRYQLQKLIAGGGFGQIFLAFDRILGRKVVIKTLRRELLQNRSAVEHFIGEAKLNSQLDHPGILPLFGLDGDSQGGLHLAMQLVRGITLKEYLSRARRILTENPPSQTEFKQKLRERLEMFLRICDAIEYCHSRKIIHNDLKPDNVMIARYGQLYVMDWGSATFEHACQEKNMTGTPAYIAPERVRDRIATRQSDVFSLGMMLNEMVTLQPPISGVSSEEILRKLIAGLYPPSVCLNPAYRLPSALRAIIGKARATEPKQRYQDVRQLAGDVRNLLFHEAVSAKPDHFWQKWLRELYHHPHFSYLLLLTTAVTIAGLLVFSFIREQHFVNRINAELLLNAEERARVDRLSLAISRRLLQLREQLNGLDSALTLQLEEEQVDRRTEFFRNEDFRPGSRSSKLHGLIHARAYPNAISLRHGSWHCFGREPAAAEKVKLAGCVNRQLNQWHAALMTDFITENGKMINPLRQFLNRGGLIRTIIASFNNGMVFCYPGSWREVPSRFGYHAEFIQRKLRGTNGIWWSLPEQDDSGEWLIACWIPLRDDSGCLLGAIGFELSYLKLIQPLQEQVSGQEETAIYTLVDEANQVLYDSRLAYHTRSRIVSKSYPFPALLRSIREKDALPQFKTTLHQQVYRISWTRIPFSGWLLIRHLPAADGMTQPR